MIRNLLQHWRFVTALSLLVSLFAVLYFFLATSAGVQFVLQQVPGLQVAQVEGRLLNRLQLQGIQYQQGDMQAKVDSLEFDWRFLALLGLHVHVEQLKLVGVQLNLPTSPEEAPAESESLTRLPDIDLPVSIQLDDISIENFSLQQGEQSLQLASVRLRAETQDEHLHIQELSLQQFAYAPMLQLQQASLQADFKLLHPHKLHLSQATIAGLNLNLPEATDTNEAPAPQNTSTEPQAMSLPDIQLPLDIAVDEFLLKQVRVQQVAGDLSLQQLRLALHTENQQLVIDDFSLQDFQHPQVQIPQVKLTGHSDLQSPHALELKLSTNAVHEQSGSVFLDVDVQGNPDALQADVAVKLPGDAKAEALQLQLNAQAWELLKDLRWQATVDLQGVNSQHPRLHRYLQTAPALQAVTHLQAQGDLENLSIQLQLDTEVEGYGAFVLQTQARNLGDWQAWEVQQLQVQHPESELQLQAQAQIDLHAAQPQIEAQLDWQNVRWPLQDEQIQAASPSGKLSFQGTPEAYQLNLHTQAQAEGAPDSEWQLSANGSTEQLHISQLQGKLLEGMIEFSGDVGWQPQPRWHIQVNGENINPGSQWQDWPGKIALALRTQGQLKANNELHADVQGLQVQGQLRDYPLSLAVDAKARGQQYEIQQLRLRSGEAQVQVSGQVSDTLALDWQLQASSLAGLYPDLKGSLQGAGKVAGPLAQPKVAANLSGKQLGFQDAQIKALKLQAQVDLQPQGEFNLDLQADAVQQGTTQVEKLSLQGSGMLENHSVELQVNLPVQSAKLRLEGGLHNMDSWRGQLHTLQLKDKQWGDVVLSQPSVLQVSAQQAKLGPSCLQWRNAKLSQSPQLCLQADWLQSGKAQAEVKLDPVDLAVFQPLLPENLRLHDLQASLDLSGGMNAKGELQADVLFAMTPGKVGLVSTEAPELTLLQHEGTQLRATIDKRGLQALLSLQLPKQDGIQAEVRLPQLSSLPLAEKQPLDGNLKLRFADFSLVPVFAPQVAEPQGVIEADIKLAGNLQKPLLEGNLNLRDGGVKVDVAGLDLHDLQLALSGNEQGILNLKGQLRLGEDSQGEEGLLRLEGGFTPGEQWQAEFKAKGQRLEVMNTPDIWLLASPDINFSGTPEGMSLDGEIVVPEALLTPPETQGSGRVSASDDVIVIQEQQEQAPEQDKSVPFATRVRLVLGDKVRVKGMGFKGRLTGDLTANSKPGEVLTGNGRITVLDGIYRAYGQDLKVRKGHVLYTGGPIENPGLDVQAVRTVGDVAAGVEVTGTALAPELNLFSEPALDQTNILSYIVLGRPASGGGSDASIDQRRMLAQAISEFALDEDGDLSKTLRDDLGLDSAGIDTTDGADQATFMIGKYLTPDLYVSYGVGLFDAENVFRMNYRLTERLSVESSSSGSNSGVDLRYVLER